MEQDDDKKMPANRKRNRPEWKQATDNDDTVKQDDNDDQQVECLQTPHTLRLLKLIQEGTLEHAQIAASHLAALDASPIVLWDLLGRLGEFLLVSNENNNWSTRLHASLAMQGVAQHLPPSNQRDFLEATYSGPLWLTIQQVSEGLDTITSNGRILLAARDSKLDDDDNVFALQQQQQDKLKQLDNENRQELQQDFVEQRVRLQREILAQRLGLGGVVQAVGGSVLSNVITKEDLLMNDKTNQKQPPTKRPRTRMNDDGSSIRALLVMEMQHQQDRGATSHASPQTLLATELIYRMFDPSWHVRHGAFLGTLSLLRAWKGRQHAFGMWPHDIMARCLCVLSLDRFGDYSGASTGEHGDSGGGDGVVAPVREMAGQLLSVLWAMAPTNLQQECLQVLIRLSSRDEWEVRHGALLAFKYIAAVLSNNVLADTVSTPLLVKVRNDISVVAKERLSDKLEDVGGVAAQVLSCILSSTQDDESNKKSLIQASCLPLWDAIGRLSGISSCAVDLVCLFSEMIRVNVSCVIATLGTSMGNTQCVLGAVADKLVHFLNYESMAVNIAAFKAIQAIAQPFAAIVATEEDSKETTDELVRSYCRLLEHVFLTHVSERYAVDPHEDDKECRIRYEKYCSARDDAWAKLVDCAKPVLSAWPSHRGGLLVRLLLNHVKVRYTAVAGAAVLHNQGSARAIARFLSKIGNDTFSLHSFMETFFSLLLNSPWIEHCEKACILYQELNVCGYPVLEKSHALLQDMLQEAPPCISPGMAELVLNPMDIEVVEQVIESSLITVLTEENKQNILQEPERFWFATIQSHGLTLLNVRGPPIVNTSSMRLHSLIAGALASVGLDSLPTRLTPLVRALMTSLKSERSPERRVLTSESLARLLNALSGSSDESRLRVRTKVIENVCGMLSPDASAQDAKCTDSIEAASHVIVLLISNLAAGQTLEDIQPIWTRLCPLTESSHTMDQNALDSCLQRLAVVCKPLRQGHSATRHVVDNMMEPLAPLASAHRSSNTRAMATAIIVVLCQRDPELAMDTVLPVLFPYMHDKENDPRRLGSLRLLQSIIEGVGTEVCPFVRCLLPVTMSLMTDPLEDCAKQAAQSFASLVRVSPIVKHTLRRRWARYATNDQSDKVIDHLIHGEPLPPCVFPASVVDELKEAGVSLREYQLEGISWLRFLQQVRLNGILADDMGLGKSVEALTAVALSHDAVERADSKCRPVSLVVCPSTLVGHWLAEIRKFFPSQDVLRGTSDIGVVKQWSNGAESVEFNIVVVSYSVLRREIDALSSVDWLYCILDEGHLLKNPKTATAISARQLRAQHKLILTGTPVQNRVHELWAAFDFLMPNFLGSQAWFSSNFARPINNGQLPGATAQSISDGMEKLKLLHQQVLPFILRREKEQVMKELPPKCIVDIPCALCETQQDLYEEFCHGSGAKRAVLALRNSIDATRSGNGEPTSAGLGGEALKALLYLRLLCTHPSLVDDVSSRDNGRRTKGGRSESLTRFDSSGKLKALNDLLRSAHVCGDELTAADNDASALYTDFDEGAQDDASALIATTNGDAGNLVAGGGGESVETGSKCLIFAQFTQSLDIVERLLFQTQMPSLRYLRLDGSVPPAKRAIIVDSFNRDESIKVMLLTSRVGSLGLNLTGASTVIFLEHDYNPHADLQAMDRAHRIGQTKTVNVYRLITQNTIEEKIMKLQEKKMAMSRAIVNAENSTMYSMGTDRLLDIFTFRSDANGGRKSTSGSTINLDALEESYSGEDYASLSVNSFLEGFR